MRMGIFDWLLEHAEEDLIEGPENKVLVPPQRAHVEEADVIIVPFGDLNPGGHVDGK
jgi:hypothetical protein